MTTRVDRRSGGRGGPFVDPSSWKTSVVTRLTKGSSPQGCHPRRDLARRSDSGTWGAESPPDVQTLCRGIPERQRRLVPLA